MKLLSPRWNVLIAGLLLVGLIMMVASSVSAKDQFSYFRSVKSPAGVQSGEPFLFVTGEGAVYLSWIEKGDETKHRMRFSKLDGDTWSAPLTIAEGSEWFVNWADVPSITVSDDGRLAAHWLEKNGAGTYSYGVRIVTSEDGGRTWGKPIIPHTAGEESEHGFVSMRFIGDDLWAAWLDGRKFMGENPSKEMTVRVARIGRDGSVGTSAEVDGRACDCCPMDFVVSGEQGFLAYRDRSGDETRDISIARFDVTTNKQPEITTLSKDNWKIEGCPVNGPALDTNGDDVFVAWFTIDDESPRVKCATIDRETGVARKPFQVDDGTPLGRVDIVALGDGYALVCWIEEGDEDADIRIRLVRSDGWKGASELITVTSSARASGYPRIVKAGDRIVAAWTDASDPSHVRTALAKISDLTRNIQ